MSPAQPEQVATAAKTPRMTLAEERLARGDERAAMNIAREILSKPWTDAERTFAEELLQQLAIPNSATLISLVVLAAYVVTAALALLLA